MALLPKVSGRKIPFPRLLFAAPDFECGGSNLGGECGEAR
jgi:hypothetical protein